MRKFIAITAALAALFYAQNSFAQSNPALIYGQVPTAGQWNSYFSSKQDVLGYTPVNKAGDVMQGLLTTAPSTNFTAGLHITPGAAPTSPNYGDMWISSNAIFAYLGGVTVQLQTIGGGGGSVVADGTPANNQFGVWTSSNSIKGYTAAGDVTFDGTNFNVGSIGRKSINLAGALATVGAHNLTLTTTADTNVTLPTSGTLLSTSVTSLPSLATIGTIGTGVWNGTTVGVAYGGTGITSGTSGGVLAFTGSGTLASSGVLALGQPVIGAGAGAVPTSGTRSGNTTEFATATGTLTPGDCVQLDANSNFVDAGGPCTTGGGGGTVSSGTAGQLSYYGSTGTTVVGNANATISSGAMTLGVATSVQGSLALSGSTSGTTTLTPNVAASGTLTLPAATDTLVGKATTDTLTNKTWNGVVIGSTYGGTGVNNGSSTITLGGNFTTSGAFPLTLTQTGSTSLTLPTSGTVTALGNSSTGSGSVVLATSPTLVTPTLGVASATSINKLTITQPASSATLTVANGKTATVSNTLTFTGTDSSSVALGAGGTVAYLGTAQAYTAQQNFSPATALSSSGTIAWNLNTAQVAKVTLTASSTMAAPTNLVDGGTYILRVVQGGTGSYNITWNAVFKWPGGTAPTLSTAVGAIDIITFTSDGTNMYGVGQTNFH